MPTFSLGRDFNATPSSNQSTQKLITPRKLLVGILGVCFVFLVIYQFGFFIKKKKPIQLEGNEGTKPNNPAVLPLLVKPNNNNNIEKNNENRQKGSGRIAKNPTEIELENYEGISDYLNKDLKTLPYLGIVMPTIPRGPKQQLKVDYFTPTLASYHAEFQKHPILGKLISMYVMNMRGNEKHELFEKLHDQYKETTYGNEERKVWNFNKLDTSEVYQAPDGKSIIPPTAHRQTSDVIHFLSSVDKKTKYLLIVEDDFLVCELALTTILHLIEKSNARYGENGWAAIRIASGLNGIIMRNENGDVAAYAEHLIKRIGKRPPDHLFTEFAARETPSSLAYFGNRYMVAYKYNLLFHLGKVSTIRATEHYDMPKCWETLIYPVSFEVEAFDPKQCPTDDLWPCTKYTRIQSQVVADIPIVDVTNTFPTMRPMKLGSSNTEPKGVAI